jgi:hypothetical protein
MNYFEDLIDGISFERNVNYDDRYWLYIEYRLIYVLLIAS